MFVARIVGGRNWEATGRREGIHMLHTLMEGIRRSKNRARWLLTVMSPNGESIFGIKAPRTSRTLNTN